MYAQVCLDTQKLKLCQQAGFVPEEMQTVSKPQPLQVETGKKTMMGQLKAQLEADSGTEYEYSGESEEVPSPEPVKNIAT